MDNKDVKVAVVPGKQFCLKYNTLEQIKKCISTQEILPEVLIYHNGKEERIVGENLTELLVNTEIAIKKHLKE